MSDAPVTRDARPRHQDGLHIAAPPSQIDRHGGGAATCNWRTIVCQSKLQTLVRMASLQRQNGE
jgi:hypothetical protein